MSRSTGAGRYSPRLLGAAAATILLAAACTSGASSAQSGAIKQGGVFRLGSPSTIDSLNPFVGIEFDAYATWEHIYPMLVQYNPKGQIVPDFATSWHESPDGLTWTFHTQPSAKWSDGKPLTAADAAWTYNTIVKFKNGPTAALSIPQLQSASAPNPDTLVLTYAHPSAAALADLQPVPILPEHVWAKYATGNGHALRTFQNNAPIVSGGPFILEKYAPRADALFKRNPTFYGPKPHIAGLALEFFSNTDAMVIALKNGQLDGVESVPPTTVAGLKAAHLDVVKTPSIYFDDISINSNPQQDASHKELLNPLLREAFDYAIDRQAIVRTSLLGYGQPGSSIIPPSTGHWYDQAIKPTPFDLSKANQLLDQAGYKMGPNGIRIANGHPMSYSVILPADTTNGYGERSFLIVQQDFKKIGVQLTPRNLDNSAAFSAITADHYKSFELVMWDWFPNPDPNFMLGSVTCQAWYAWSDTGYCNKTYDNLFQRQSATTNPQKRQQIVYKMQQMIYNARPYLVLDYTESLEAHNAKWVDLPTVGGVSWSTFSKIPFETLHLAG